MPVRVVILRKVKTFGVIGSSLRKKFLPNNQEVLRVLQEIDYGPGEVLGWGGQEARMVQDVGQSFGVGAALCPMVRRWTPQRLLSMC